MIHDENAAPSLLFSEVPIESTPMPYEVSQLPVAIFHSATGAMETPYLVATRDVAVFAPPPDRRVVDFAVRTPLRTGIPERTLRVLQRCAGIVLTMIAWIVFLGGLAHFVIAALHNREGELGKGLDATILGAYACAASVILAGIGVPNWVFAERKLRNLAKADRAPGTVHPVAPGSP